MPDLTMPRLSDSMEDGVIAEWLVADGGHVTVGQEIVEIETDKTNVTFEAEYSGVLHHGADPGDTVAVGDYIGAIVDAVSAPEEAPSAPGAESRSLSAPTKGEAADTPSVATPRVARHGASPTAIRLAEQLGVDLQAVPGSGFEGRVLRRDVIDTHEAVGERQAAAPAVPQNSGTPLSRAQLLLADRMSLSKNTIPDFTVTRDVDLTRLFEWRTRVKEQDNSSPSLNSILMAATARTLARHPLLTSRFVDDSLVFADTVNLSFAVATEGVLHAPVLKAAEAMSLRELGEQAQRLAQAARHGGLAVADIIGGNFTVSNLGMLDVRRFTAIINAGQVAILAIGAVRQDVVVHNSALSIGWFCEMALTCDHRVIYGQHAAEFLADLSNCLNSPELLA